VSNETEFKISNHNGWKIFSVIGRLDTVTAPDAEQAIAAILKENDKIALDMTEMDYISSAGLKVLLRNAKQANRAQKNFVLCDARGVVDKVLKVSGMNLLVKIYETQEDLP
jgi:anti-anti-sigma factor